MVAKPNMTSCIYLLGAVCRSGLFPIPCPVLQRPRIFPALESIYVLLYRYNTFIIILILFYFAAGQARDRAALSG